LADGARGPARVAVVAATDWIGRDRLAAVADARHALDATETAAVRVRAADLTRGATAAGGLADEDPVLVRRARAAAAFASARRDTCVGERRSAVTGAGATLLACHDASRHAGRVGRGAKSGRRSLGLGADAAAALRIRRANVAV